MELSRLTKEQRMELDARLHYKRTKLTKIVDSFVDSEEDIMEILLEEGEYASPSNCTSSIKQYLKKTHRDMWVDVKTLDGRVYIFKTDERPIIDEVRTCIDCKEEFLLEAGTIKWCMDKCITPFVRCESCRAKRKLMKGKY